MPRSRNAALLGAALIAIAATTAARAEAAPRIARAALDHAALNQLQRLGLIVVGAEDGEAVAARTFVAASLVAAGHQAVPLPTSPSAPGREWLLGQCAAHDLDAVALVRISTDPPGWRVKVDIEDPEGRAVSVGTNRRSSDLYPGGDGALVPSFASYSFTMTDEDVAAQARTRSPAADQDPDAAAAHEAGDDRPRLWVSERTAMFGPVRIQDEEFFRLVGRPDLYRRHRAAIVTTRVLGYTSLGAGLTTLVLAAVAAGLETGACTGVNALKAISDNPEDCHGGGGSLFAIPLALSALGGGLLITAAALSSDRPPLETRKQLARAYNARLDDDGGPSSQNTRPPPRVRIAVSGTPSLNGEGGVMLINGRF